MTVTARRGDTERTLVCHSPDPEIAYYCHDDLVTVGDNSNGRDLSRGKRWDSS